MQVQSSQNTYCQALTTYKPITTLHYRTQQRKEEGDKRNMQKEQIAEKNIKDEKVKRVDG